jgi:fatty aldehyde-generating acyl-ACP reductase
MNKSLFLVHPRNTYQEYLENVGLQHPEFIKLSEQELESIIPLLPPEFTSIHNKQIPIGWLGVIPLKGSQIVSDDLAEQRMMKKRALEKINTTINMAIYQSKGEHLVVGLGALTAPITRQGQDLMNRFNGHPVSITTGNAYTAFITIKSIEQLAQIRGVDLRNVTIAILGASGSVGGAVSRHFGKMGCNLILIARNINKLNRLKDDIVSNGGIPERVLTSNNINDLKKAKVIIVTTSSSQVLIKPEHCATNAIIYDDTQPRNTSEEIKHIRKDVLVIDGGIVATPNLCTGKAKIGLPPKRAYACFSESLILAKHDCRENFVGNVTLDQVSKVAEIASHYSDDFFLAPFTSFGEAIDMDRLKGIAQ